MYGPVQTDSRLLDVKVMLHGTIFFCGYQEKRFTQIYKALYGDAEEATVSQSEFW